MKSGPEIRRIPRGVFWPDLYRGLIRADRHRWGWLAGLWKVIFEDGEVVEFEGAGELIRFMKSNRVVIFCTGVPKEIADNHLSSANKIFFKYSEFGNSAKEVLLPDGETKGILQSISFSYRIRKGKGENGNTHGLSHFVVVAEGVDQDMIFAAARIFDELGLSGRSFGGAFIDLVAREHSAYTKEGNPLRRPRANIHSLNNLFMKGAIDSPGLRYDRQGKYGEAVKIDLRSAYATAALTPWPVGSPVILRHIGEADRSETNKEFFRLVEDERRPGFMIADIVVKEPAKFPVFPIRTGAILGIDLNDDRIDVQDGGLRTGFGGLVENAPIISRHTGWSAKPGKYENVCLTSDEYNTYLELGYEVIPREAAVWREVTDVPPRVVKRLIELKDAEPDPVRRTVYKMIVNAGVGMMNFRGERGGKCSRKGDEFEVETGKTSGVWYLNSLICRRERATMWQLIYKLIEDFDAEILQCFIDDVLLTIPDEHAEGLEEFLESGCFGDIWRFKYEHFAKVGIRRGGTFCAPVEQKFRMPGIPLDVRAGGKVFDIDDYLGKK